MKKILNLLAGVTLVASSAAPVIACGSKTPSPETPTQIVNAIYKDITNKKIPLAYGRSYSLNSKADQAVMKQHLATANPKLNNDSNVPSNWQDYITFNAATGAGTTINPETASTPGTILIKDGTAKTTVNDVTYSINNTWAPLKNSGIPLTGTGAATLNFAPVQVGAHYYVGTKANGLWYSDDGLTGWKKVKKATGESADFDTATVSSKPTQIGGNTGVYYVATSKGLWWSADGINDWTQAEIGSGATATKLNADLTAPPIKATTTVSGVETTAYYLGSYSGGTTGGIWTSANGKTGWTQQTGTGKIDVDKKLKAPITKLNTLGEGGQSNVTKYFAEAENGGIYESTDLNTWTPAPQIGTYSSSVPPMQVKDHEAKGSKFQGFVEWYMPTTEHGLFVNDNEPGAGDNEWDQFGTGQLKSYFPTTADVTATPKLIPVTTKVNGKMITQNRLYVPTNKGLYYGVDDTGYGPSYYMEWITAKGFPTSTKADPTAATNFSSAPVNLGTSDNPFFVLGANNSDGGGLWTSTDGINWTVNKSIPNTTHFASSATHINGTYLIASEAAGGLWAIKPITN